MTVPRAALFGEILFDRFADGARILGGAPLNVAAHLARLGLPPLLVSRIGEDEDGAAALVRIVELGVETRGIQRDASLPTGAVDVDLSSGDPRFDILPDRAWDAIAADPALAAVAVAHPTLLYHGVLASRSPVSRATLERLCEESALPRFVDVNLRPPWTPLERARRLSHGAAWLKINRDELDSLAGPPASRDVGDLESRAEKLRRELEVERLVVTLGDRGAILLANDRAPWRARAAPPIASDGVDTVGAGDALSAALILGALQGWTDVESLDRGVELAAAVCGVRGAIPRDDAFYRPFRDDWGVAA